MAALIEIREVNIHEHVDTGAILRTLAGIKSGQEEMVAAVKALVDQSDDKSAATKLSAEVNATAAAMKAATPQT